MKYVEVNGQIWVKTVLPEGERYQRLVRGRANETNLVSFDKLKEMGEVSTLARLDYMLSLD